MSSSKKDFYIVSKLILECINGLSESEFTRLVNGQATIKYVSKDISSQTKDEYDTILKILVQNSESEDIKQVMDNIEGLQTKSKKNDFCRYLNLSTRVKDTNEELKENILNYVRENKEEIVHRISRKEDVVSTIDEIAKKLETYMDEEEAKKFIIQNPIMQSKINLIKLANRLEVYIDKDRENEDIINDIVAAVVGAKLRSYRIRKKI